MNTNAFMERYQRIQQDQEHGAAFLARESLRALAASIEPGNLANREEFRQRFIEIARQLITVRPGMPAIGHLVVRATEKAREAYLEGLPPDVLCDRVIQDIQELSEASRKAHQDAIHHAADFLEADSGVLTLSWSSNVQDALLMAGNKLRRVFVAESRPMNEGLLLARQLGQAGIPTTLLPDAAMGWALDKVSLILLGADGVLQDGSLANKMGSSLLALAARERGIPVYSICETFKYHVGAVPFEGENKPTEQISPPIPGVDIFNLYFEIIPARLIRGYITELGIVSTSLAAEQIRRWQHHYANMNLFGKWQD